MRLGPLHLAARPRGIRAAALSTAEQGAVQPGVFYQLHGVPAGVGAVDTSDIRVPELSGIQLYDEYDRMRSTGLVWGALRALKLPLLSADWTVEPASDDRADVEIASWLESALIEGMDHTWDYALRHMLLALDYGAMPIEPVFRVADDPDFGRPLLRLERLAPRMPRTISEWLVDERGTFFGVRQSLMTSAGWSEATIERAKHGLLLFANEIEGADFRGRSVLRSARVHWHYMDNLYRIEAIALEKRAMGVDVGKLTGPGGEGQPTDDLKAAAELALQTLRAHERNYLIETPGFDYRIEGLRGSVLDPGPAIDRHQLDLLRTLGAEFLGMGDREGARAVHQDKTSLFLMGERATGRMVTSEVDRRLIPRWVDANWPNVTRYPKLRHSRLDSRDEAAVVEALAKLIPIGALTPGRDLEEEARALLELPPLPEDSADDLPGDETVPDEPDAAAIRGSQKHWTRGWKTVRTEARERDGHRCRVCKRACPAEAKTGTDHHPVHHDDPEQGDVLANLRTLCPDCHKAQHRGNRTAAASGAKPARQLTRAERSVDFASLDRTISEGQAAIVRNVKARQRDQVDKLVEEGAAILASGNLDRLESLRVPGRDAIAAAIAGTLRDLYRTGQRSVEREAEIQAGRAILARGVDPDDDAEVGRFLTSRARALAALLADRLRSALTWQVLDQAKRGQANRGDLRAALVALSDREVRKLAGGTVSEALGFGRDAAAQANARRVKRVEYSALLDGGTCGPCGELDGVTFELGTAEYAAARPPFRECEGRGRCRCAYVYVFDSELT